MITIIPSPGWVLVKRHLPGAVTAGGIHVPDTVRFKHPGITPGESSRVEVLAVSPQDVENGFDDIPTPGDTVFVLAQNDNLVPVVTEEHGQVTMENGFQVPDTYLFKLSAVAGRIARDEQPVDAEEKLRAFVESARAVKAAEAEETNDHD